MSFLEVITPPEIISKDGHLIDELFYYITWMIGFYFLVICIALIYVSYRYSAKRNPQPLFTYGNKKVHVWITTFLGALVFFSVDFNITRISNNDMMNFFWKNPKEALKIEVLGLQWMWAFRYPNEEGKFNTKEDLVLNSELRIPVNRPVVFQITSKDVIHSLFFPHTRLKTDAIPGKVTRLWFEPVKTGTFEIVCAEMCGANHYLMKAKLVVMKEDEYDEWLKKQREVNMNLVSDEFSHWGWEWRE